MLRHGHPWGERRLPSMDIRFPMLSQLLPDNWDPLYLLLISVPLLILYRSFTTTKLSSAPRAAPRPVQPTSDTPKTIMQPANPDLAPPKDDEYTMEQLKAFDGSDPNKPIYVAIKGTIFDVSKKVDMYGPGKSYNIFAGKDGSKGLGKSSLNEHEAVPDYSDLDESEMKVLNEWHAFFSKRYNIVGRVTDLPVFEKR